MESTASLAAKHVRDIVTLAIEHHPSRKALVVFDVRSPLSRLLGDAYKEALPHATFLDFDMVTADMIMDEIKKLEPGDLTVLVQSTNFRLSEFRIRIELFQRGLSVIEHVHLERATDDRQIEIYVDALAYDPSYYRTRGHLLKERIDAAETIKVIGNGTVLTYEGGMEETKLNVGDYEGMKNVGGTFPIGEVFSEPKDFNLLNGEAMIFAFAGTDHLVKLHEPFKIRIEKGILVSHEGPKEFQEVLDQISAEEEIMVREFGVGLNPAFSKERVVNDITAFERQKGLHLSLGEKHGVYAKPGLVPKKTHFHIDIFVEFERIEADGEDLLR